jgi:hypothetical protein
MTATYIEIFGRTNPKFPCGIHHLTAQVDLTAQAGEHIGALGQSRGEGRGRVYSSPGATCPRFRQNEPNQAYSATCIAARSRRLTESLSARCRALDVVASELRRCCIDHTAVGLIPAVGTVRPRAAVLSTSTVKHWTAQALPPRPACMGRPMKPRINHDSVKLLDSSSSRHYPWRSASKPAHWHQYRRVRDILLAYAALCLLSLSSSSASKFRLRSRGQNPNLR